MNRHNMSMRFLAVCICALTATVCSRLNAQTMLHDKVYAEALEAFWRQDYARSKDLLSQQINMGVDDPRLFYFRGLANGKLGIKAEAVSDIENAAMLEFSVRTRVDIGSALERIQGPARRKIEAARRNAQLQLMEMQRLQMQMRLEALPQTSPVVPPALK